MAWKRMRTEEVAMVHKGRARSRWRSSRRSRTRERSRSGEVDKGLGAKWEPVDGQTGTTTDRGASPALSEGELEVVKVVDEDPGCRVQAERFGWDATGPRASTS